jgi:hypothetical protein
MLSKVSSRPREVVLEQERIGQNNTVVDGLRTACQSCGDSFAHGHFVARKLILHLPRGWPWATEFSRLWESALGPPRTVSA